MLSDLQRLFPSLVAGTALPPMQEQPRENREPLPEPNVKEIEPSKQRKPRTPKAEPAAEEVKTEDKGESTASASTDAAKTASPSESETNTASTDSPSPTGETIPDIEDLRARLKTLGATEGFGHDKVFEVLGKYDAKNASTVPVEKRAACIAEIDDLLKGGAK